MSLTLLALLVASPQAEADPPFRTRMCTDTSRAAIQLAYKPYENGVFGSDGVTCRTVKPGPDQPPARGKKPTAAPDDEPKARPR
jgi:hypothetical protein